MNFLFFYKDCKSKRLCCLQCNGEFQGYHPESLIEIDSFNELTHQESNKQVEYPYGQCQLIQNLEELLVIIDSFQKLIREHIEKLKKSNIQEYLNQKGNDQQGVQAWNRQIEHMLQYFQVKNHHLTKKDQKQGELNETEEKFIIIINQAKDGLKQNQQLFRNYLQQQSKQLRFQSNPIRIEGHKDDVNGVTISPDGGMIASGSDDKTVKLWNVQSKKLMQTFQHAGKVYGGVAFSPNNQYLAYGGFGDYSIQLQDLKQNTNCATLKGHKNTILTIVFSQDSQLLRSGGIDKKLIVWNISSHTQINRFDTDSTIFAIVNSLDNNFISCICQKSINVWNFSTRSKLIYQKDPHNTRGYGLCSSKDCSMFISSGEDGLIEIWMLSESNNNEKSFKVTREIKADKGIYKVIFTPDEDYIIPICNQLTKIMIHEIKSGNIIQELQYGDGDAQYFDGYISISNDMNVLACGGQIKQSKFGQENERNIINQINCLHIIINIQQYLILLTKSIASMQELKQLIKCSTEIQF